MPLQFRAVALAGCVFFAVFSSSLVAEEAPEIVRSVDHFEFIYRATLPALEYPGRLLLPLAKTDAFQTVEVRSIDSALPYRRIVNSVYHNTLLEFSPGAGDGGKVIEIRYEVRRQEKTDYSPKEGDDPTRYLTAERLVPKDAAFRAIADEATHGVSANDTLSLSRARALYEHVLGRMKYDKTGVGWGRGDALRACDARTGNCTDFHSYFIALARAEGIPARFAIGATIPADKDEGVIAGYHCWAEFFADGQWTPVDISEAWNHPALAEYYFGHQPANRFELSAGRDLAVDPPLANGPLNFLVYPYLEVDVKEVKAAVEFRFRRLHDVPSLTSAATAPAATKSE